MQGELLKNTNVLINDAAVQRLSDISMKSVTEPLCPSSLSERVDGANYGNVTHFTYFSNTTNCERGANILLPSDYDSNKKYPVLYFLHGIFGDENSMIMDPNNHLAEIIGNLKAQNMIQDIIVVFPHMYATGDPDLKPGFLAEQIVPYDNFVNDLANDLIPYVEANYAVCKDREHRGLVGFSMGGRETLFIGLTRSDLFSHIGAFAPAPGLVPAKDWAMEHIGQLSVQDVQIAQKDYDLSLLLLCCGTKDSVVGTYPKEYHNIMDQNLVNHLWYEIPEADHDSNAIRSGFYHYLIRWAR